MTDRLRRTLILGGGGTLGGAVLAPAVAAAGTASRAVPLLSTYVAGTGYHDAPRCAPRLRNGDEVVLRRRPGNSYDARTVEVRTTDGALLGYIPRVENQALSNLMDAGFPATARVRSVMPDTARPEIRLDVSVAMAV